jgi:hypothetical protein
MGVHVDVRSIGAVGYPEEAGWKKASELDLPEQKAPRVAGLLNGSGGRI